MYTIIAGTNRTGSKTLKIARQYEQLLNKKGILTALISLENFNVFKRSDEMEKLEKEVLIPSDKIIFVSPEYNGSIPGVLKSLIDISDIKNVWRGKKALLIGISSGRAGNLRGMDHLTGILNYIKVIVYPFKLSISLIDNLLNEDGVITETDTLASITMQLDEFVNFKPLLQEKSRTSIALWPLQASDSFCPGHSKHRLILIF
jgi:chromate reductase